MPTRFPLIELAGVLALVGAGVVVDDTARRVAALAAAAGALLWVIRDAAGRVRLRAGADGVGVRTGYLGWTELAWPEIESLGIDDRTRRGLRSRLLEVDAGERLFLLSAKDLGADVGDVLAQLHAIGE